MIRQPPISTLFPTRRSSDLLEKECAVVLSLQAKTIGVLARPKWQDRKSTRLNSSHSSISYAVFCLKKKTWGYCSAVTRHGWRWVVDAHCGEQRRYIVDCDEL